MDIGSEALDRLATSNTEDPSSKPAMGIFINNICLLLTFRWNRQ